jgi:hypothetical protein
LRTRPKDAGVVYDGVQTSVPAREHRQRCAVVTIRHISCEHGNMCLSGQLITHAS